MMKCGECGLENMDGLDYCDGCGAKLSGTAPATISAPPEKEIVISAPDAVKDLVVEAPDQPAAGTVNQSVSGGTESSAPTGEMTAPAPAPTPAPPPAAAAAPFKAKLTITRGTIPERRNHEFDLENGNNLIGRWDPDTGSFPEVDLDADDPEAKISRKHALIRIDSGKITIEDIGSLNGTYVNRQPRMQPGTPAELKDGDEVIIGKTFLKLTVSPIS